MSRGVFVTDEQVRLTGSPNVARFLAQCLYWSNIELVKNRQGWFYKSREEWKSETWLSRYQQEKARRWLRDAGLLQESRERLQTGIRLWFWLDQALYNQMINNLAEKDELVETGDCPGSRDELYDSLLMDEPENNKTDVLEECKDVTESNVIEECKTIVPTKPLKELKSSFKPEISTNVSDNNKPVETENSDVSCDDDFEIDLDLETYKSCHPFIYQYMQTRVLSGLEQDQKLFKCFSIDGFNQHVVDDLGAFIDRYGHKIIRWYKENTPVRIKPMTMDDLNFAARVSIKWGAP